MAARICLTGELVTSWAADGARFFLIKRTTEFCDSEEDDEDEHEWFVGGQGTWEQEARWLREQCRILRDRLEEIRKMATAQGESGSSGAAEAPGEGAS